MAKNTGLADSQYQIESLLVTSHAIYAGTLAKGIYKSTDAGDSWTQINTGLPSYSYPPYGTYYVGVNSLASDEGTPETLYIGTSDINYPDADEDFRMYKSMDGGNTWARLDVGGYDFKALYRSIAVDSLDTSIIYAVADNYQPELGNGFYIKLDDYGATVVNYISGTGGNLVAVDDSDPAHKQVWVGSQGKGLWLSLDEGFSFFSIDPSSLLNLFVKSGTGGFNRPIITKS